LEPSCAYQAAPVRVRARAVDIKENRFRHGTELRCLESKASNVGTILLNSQLGMRRGTLLEVA